MPTGWGRQAMLIGKTMMGRIRNLLSPLRQDPMRTAVYSLIPRSILAYKWTGQKTPEVCTKTGCLDKWNVPNFRPHVHQRGEHLPVKDGQWVCRGFVTGTEADALMTRNNSNPTTVWVMDDAEFARTYRLGER